MRDNVRRRRAGAAAFRLGLAALLLTGAVLPSLPGERAAAGQASAILYVTEGGAGGMNGASWTDALAGASLQHAIDTATAGTQIWVAAGTYYPTEDASGNENPADVRTKAFHLKSGVAVYGGFAGTESGVEERDWEANRTTLSGNIGASDSALDNAYHVFYHPSGSVDGTALLDGVTIAGGYGNGSGANGYGGGMYNANSSPTLDHVTVSDNYSYTGGGMYNNGSSPALTDVTISGNTASNGGGLYNDAGSSPTLTNAAIDGNKANSFGGGLYNNGSSPTLARATINGNTSSGPGGGMYNTLAGPSLTDVTISGNTAYAGGGMYSANNSSPTLANVVIRENATSADGGGVYSSGSSFALTHATVSGNRITGSGAGGGIYSTGGSPTLTDVTIGGNSGNMGGGFYMLSSDAKIFGATISGNTAVMGGGLYVSGGSLVAVNAVVTGNVATGNGGGLYSIFDGTLNLTNATIAGNKAATGGGLSSPSSGGVIRNSIVWGNAGASKPAIEVYGTSLTIASSLFQGSGGSGSGWATSYGADGGGNADADPLFVAPAAADAATEEGDYRLKTSSPAVDAGDNGVFDDGKTPDLSAVATDRAGGDRIRYGTVDMGAYEMVDETAPTATAYTPAAGAANVPIDASLQLELSEATTATAGKFITIKKAADDSVVERIEATDATRVTHTGNVYVIDPSADLAYAASYYVLVDEGAFVNGRNNKFAGIADASAWSFTTEEAPIRNSVISPTTASFDKYASSDGYADATVDATWNGNTLTGIRNGAGSLTPDTDYTVSGDRITIKKEYLATLEAGTAVLTFSFSAGETQTLAVEIADTTPSRPGVPVLHAATAGDREAILSWEPVDGAASYKIYRSTAAGTYGSELSTVSGSVNTYRAVDLTNGTKYYFVVKAVNPGGDSDASNETSVTPRTVPGAPAILSAQAGDRQAVIAFEAPADDGGSAITGYEAIAEPGGRTATGTASPLTIDGLTNGVSYTFTVRAVNEAGSGEPSAVSRAVTPRAPSGGTPIVSQPSSEPAKPEGAVVLVNGQAQPIGTATNGEVDGRSVLTVAVDPQGLADKLAGAAAGAVVSIPANADADVVIGELNGEMIGRMEQKQAILEIKTEKAAYRIPAELIDIAALSERLGRPSSLEAIKVEIEIAASSPDLAKLAADSAAAGKLAIVAPPVDFTIRGTVGDKQVEAARFDAYVERTLAIPEGVDPNKITTGVVVDSDGTIRHVPTKIVFIDGRYYARINSLTNSAYAVVWHPLAFADVANHWAKDAVNDMGARLVIDGTGDGLFSPDRAITRAEFAAIMIRALGLKPQADGTSFRDVDREAWYAGAVGTASAYGLIEGYEDGAFRPTEQITREQAAAVVAKAMKLTGLAAGAASRTPEEALAPYADKDEVSGWARSAMSECLEAGIVSGRSGSSLAPRANVTRAETAVIVERMLEKSDLIG